MPEPKTAKQMIDSIEKKIDGMTHDIKTLEGFAQELLKMRLEINSVRSAMRDFKGKIGCKYQPCHHEPVACGFTEMIERRS